VVIGAVDGIYIELVLYAVFVMIDPSAVICHNEYAFDMRQNQRCGVYVVFEVDIAKGIQVTGEAYIMRSTITSLSISICTRTIRKVYKLVAPFKHVRFTLEMAVIMPYVNGDTWLGRWKVRL